MTTKYIILKLIIDALRRPDWPAILFLHRSTDRYLNNISLSSYLRSRPHKSRRYWRVSIVYSETLTHIVSSLSASRYSLKKTQRYLKNHSFERARIRNQSSRMFVSIPHSRATHPSSQSSHLLPVRSPPHAAVAPTIGGNLSKDIPFLAQAARNSRLQSRSVLGYACDKGYLFFCVLRFHSVKEKNAT